MRNPQKRKIVMKRSMALGHCVCNPKQPCPCTIFIEQDLCPCAGERPEPKPGEVKLTRHVRKAGCASKISRKDLAEILPQLPSFEDPNVLVGVAAGDDAGVYQLDGQYNLVQTVDVFSPVVDDPCTFGRICAANSLSDVYAMGGRPICALSIIGFPIEELPKEVMVEILRGGMEKMQEAGCSVIGGHSINDEEIKAGFAVSGLVKGTGSVTNAGAQAGDVLVLTKPIGTGLISFAAQIGRASEESQELISLSMATLNRDASELMGKYGAHAATDVTGFSLLGHLSEMAVRSGVTAEMDLATIPVFAEAVACVRQEVIPGAVERNRESFLDRVKVTGGDEGLLDLLFDAQTSGGLLIALPEGNADALIQEMKSRGHQATSLIGRMIEKQEHPIFVTLSEPTNLIGLNGLKEAGQEAPVFEPAHSGACCEDLALGGEDDSGGVIRMEFDSVVEDKGMSTPEGTQEQTAAAFKNLMQFSAAGGKVDGRTKRLISVALSIGLRCVPCFQHHAQAALGEGIDRGELEEIGWLVTSFTGCTGRMFFLEQMQKLGKG
jgi:selenide, water dikinase